MRGAFVVWIVALACACGRSPARDLPRRDDVLRGSPVEDEAEPGGPRLIAIAVLGAEQPDAAGVRVVLTFDAEVRGELSPPLDEAGGRRARLRFEQLRVDDGIALPDEVAAGGLLRIERSDDGIDLVLAPGADVRGAILADPMRWVLDVDRPRPPRAIGELPRLIVLDPGHGGDEHGARVDGTRESRLVLDIAGRTAARLHALLPTTRILLTRTTDDEVSLEQRSALANSLDADLFVSIHLNDADVPVQTGGVTTFVLDTEGERQALRLAARENATTTDRVGGLSVLLAGLHRSAQVAESRALAAAVHASTLASARTRLPALPDRGVRAAEYYVLVGTRMPSILIECSFMTRPEELAALRTEGYRQALAEGIAAGIVRYTASR